jgi:hypothetical protein
MTMRARREKVHFRHPFQIKGIDRLLPRGDYEIITDENMIEGIWFPSFRRIATLILIPGAAPHDSSNQTVSINSVDLSYAQRIDASDLRE